MRDALEDETKSRTSVEEHRSDDRFRRRGVRLMVMFGLSRQGMLESRIWEPWNALFTSLTTEPTDPTVHHNRGDSDSHIQYQAAQRKSKLR